MGTVGNRFVEKKKEKKAAYYSCVGLIYSQFRDITFFFFHVFFFLLNKPGTYISHNAI